MSSDHFASPVAKTRNEPEHLSRCDFVESGLGNLVREALEKDEISLGRGAEILNLDLRQMRSLASSWAG